MATQLCSHVELQEKIHFTAHAGGDQAIDIDYTPPLGDGAGIMPLELLLMSLAACAGATVITLLRRMHQHIDGCSVDACGQRREEHPTVFTDIQLAFVFSGPALDPVAVQQAIALAESQYCPVWAMIKDQVCVSTSVDIRRPPTTS